MADKSLIACHECDLLHHMREIPLGGSARCSRCGSVLYRRPADTVDAALALTATALVLFLLARRRSLPAKGGVAMIAGPCLLVMATAFFASSNYLRPNAGLMRALICLDLESGERVWDAALFVAPEERLHRQNSFATPTPCPSYFATHPVTSYVSPSNTTRSLSVTAWL